jgi:hypothetical protein
MGELLTYPASASLPRPGGMLNPEYCSYQKCESGLMDQRNMMKDGDDGRGKKGKGQRVKAKEEDEKDEKEGTVNKGQSLD